jgi:dTDP-glucose 4,6-dehydratase
MILKALRGEALPVYGDGAHVRDWLHVDDHVAAIVAILERGRRGETYVVGGRAERKNVDVATKLLDLTRELAPESGASRSEIAFVVDRPGHDRRYAIDCGKIERELGWRPSHSFEAGLRETVAWYIARRDWWAPILEQKYDGERLGLKGAP